MKSTIALGQVRMKMAIGAKKIPQFFVYPPTEIRRAGFRGDGADSILPP
jgi:hypothetical protein